MVPTINVSEKVLQNLKGLNIPYELVEKPKPANALDSTIDYQINPSDFIILGGKSSGKDSYPDLWVCKYRLGASNAVESAGGKIGVNIRNTAKEKNEIDYIGNINREQALKLNLVLGGRTLNTRQAKDFFALLLSGNAFDGKGKKISKSKLTQIADEIFAVRAPYRAEWFEDYFTGGKQGNLTLNKNYVLKDGVLTPEYSHDLTTCSMEDRVPGIDLKDWLRNSTAQGFPKKNIKSGKLWYWPPEKDKAVGFYAVPDDASLICDRDPLSTDARLGVRHVREAHEKK